VCNRTIVKGKNIMKKYLRILAGSIASAALMMAASPAMAHADVDVNIGIPGLFPAPVYVQPRPVYVEPSPVYIEQEPHYDRHERYSRARHWQEQQWREQHHGEDRHDDHYDHDHDHHSEHDGGHHDHDD
jgi:hypothetical protein